MENQKLQSRRDFMRTAGKIVLGATALGVASPLLSAYDSAKAEATIEAPAHPFTYQKLDPTATLERGYKSFFELGGCAAGAFDAIIGQLADLVGYPFNQVPAKMYANGATRLWHCVPVRLPGRLRRRHRPAVRAADAKTILADLCAWYREHEFPAYDPDNHAPTKTVANSVNCADSVTKFMSENGITEMSDPVRLARCAAVTGEAAPEGCGAAERALWPVICIYAEAAEACNRAFRRLAL